MYITNGKVAWEIVPSFILPEGEWEIVRYLNLRDYRVGVCGELRKIKHRRSKRQFRNEKRES